MLLPSSLDGGMEIGMYDDDSRLTIDNIAVGGGGSGTHGVACLNVECCVLSHSSSNTPLGHKLGISIVSTMPNSFCKRHLPHFIRMPMVWCLKQYCKPLLKSAVIHSYRCHALTTSSRPWTINNKLSQLWIEQMCAAWLMRWEASQAVSKTLLFGIALWSGTQGHHLASPHSAKIFWTMLSATLLSMISPSQTQSLEWAQLCTSTGSKANRSGYPVSPIICPPQTSGSSAPRHTTPCMEGIVWYMAMRWL